MPIDLKTLTSTYEQYLHLNYVKSRLDPDEEPYKTKYEARELIKQPIQQLNDGELVVGIESSEFMNSLNIRHLTGTYELFLNKLDAMCVQKFAKPAKTFLIIKLFEFNLAKNYVETEEIESGERICSRILQELDTLSVDQAAALTYNPLIFNLKLSCFVELIFIWSHRSDYNKCIQILNAIDEMYQVYKSDSVKNFLDFGGDEEELLSLPFDPSELICLNTELTAKARRTSFESLYTHSLFYSAQIYGKLDEKVKSAYYCQLTLQRQIDEHNEDLTEKSPLEAEAKLKQQPLEKVCFNPLDWATHAAALSQYYVCEGDFATARHCICCADSILEKLNAAKSSGGEEADEKLNEQTQSIRRCWGKYTIELLRFAKRKLLESADLPDQQRLLAELDRTSKFHFNIPADLYDLKQVELEAITSNIPLDYEQARQVFLKAQSILNKAKEYFKLDGFVTDHSEIVRDLSDLYSCLIFFEPDPDRRCKMHKRRLDLLVPICDEINEQFYLTVKRQYLFDIGSILSEMMDLKIEILTEKQEKNSISRLEMKGAAKKINQLAHESIKRFEAFLTTMKVQPERKVLPDTFDDHNVRPALLAKFYLGRLHSKIITTDTAARLDNCKNTLDCYTYLVSYCERHGEAATATMQVEYQICKEMIAFLPAKMDKLRLTITT